MTPEQRRYIFVQSPIGSAVVNAILNGAIGWAMMRSQSEVAIWHAPGVAPDLVATAFGVAFGTCLGATLQTRFDVAKGKIVPPERLPWAGVLGRFPNSLFARAVLFGLLALPIFLPPVLFALVGSGAAALSGAHFIGLKAGFSAVEGALVAPAILLVALESHRRKVAVVNR